MGGCKSERFTGNSDSVFLDHPLVLSIAKRSVFSTSSQGSAGGLAPGRARRVPWLRHPHSNDHPVDRKRRDSAVTDRAAGKQNLAIDRSRIRGDPETPEAER